VWTVDETVPVGGEATGFDQGHLVFAQDGQDRLDDPQSAEEVRLELVAHLLFRSGGQLGKVKSARSDGASLSVSPS
jgi:hypothetical protein